LFFFFSSRRRHTRSKRDWSSDVCSSDLAGTIEASEPHEAAVVREVLEETGVNARIVDSLGIERYDVWPSKPEVHARHFFQLEPLNDSHGERWSAGEGDFPKVVPLSGGHASGFLSSKLTCFALDSRQRSVRSRPKTPMQPTIVGRSAESP